MHHKRPREGGYDNRDSFPRGGGRGGGGRGGRGSSFLDTNNIITNFFALEMSKDACIYMHTLSFPPNIQRRHERRRLFHIFAQKVLFKDDKEDQVEKKMKGIVFLGSAFYSAYEEIKNIASEGKSYELEFGSNKEKVVITVMDVKKIDLLPHKATQESIAALNVLLKRSLQQMDDTYEYIGRNYYLKKPLDVRDNDVLYYRGYATEVRFAKFSGKGELVCSINPITRVVASRTILSEILSLVKGDLGYLSDRDKKRLVQALKGTPVFTIYNQKPKPYYIDGIDFDRTPETTFTLGGAKAGVEKSYFKYLVETYGKYFSFDNNLKDRKQPMLVVRGRNQEIIHLIPEFCRSTEISARAKKNLPVNCSIQPRNRVRETTDVLNNLKSKKAQSVLQLFNNLNINARPLQSKIDKLPTPTLVVPGTDAFNMRLEDYEGKEFAKHLTQNLCWGSSPIEEVIVLVSYLDIGDTNFNDWLKSNFCGTIIKFVNDASTRFNFRFNMCPVHPNQTYIQAFEEKYKEKLKTINTKHPVIWLIALNDSDDKNNTNTYITIKDYCFSKGVVSQFIDCEVGRNDMQGRVNRVGPNVKNPDSVVRSIFNNVALQILEKMGEKSWWTSLENYIPELAPKKINKPTFIIGLDVHHAKRVRGLEGEIAQNPSVAGLVASIVTENNVWKTYCDIIPLKARDEILGAPIKFRGRKEQWAQAPKEELKGQTPTHDVLKLFVTNLIKKYGQPGYIFFYRDGVSHDQLVQVKEYEVKQIESACPSANLIYIVVQKETNARFVAKDGDNLANPVPGAVFTDGGIISPIPDFQDFYLVSTANNKGSIKPVHYCIVSGSKLIDLQKLQKFTFALCHLYPNWPGSIKVPFVVQAAHKLAKLIGDVKGGAQVTIDSRLKETYFYL